MGMSLVCNTLDGKLNEAPWDNENVNVFVCLSVCLSVCMCVYTKCSCSYSAGQRTFNAFVQLKDSFLY